MFEQRFRRYFSSWQKNIGLIAFLTILSTPLFAQKTIELNNWQFAEKGSKKFRTALVPGSVLNDLLQHGLIPDPYRNANEEKIKWVEEKAWVYTATFFIENPLKLSNGYELILEGLDTYASVFVNDSLVLKSQNMFLEYKIPLKKNLKSGINSLRIEFESATITAKELQKKSKVPYPGDERIYCRKAQFQFGWDWGPRLVNCGIWKKVYLQEILEIPEIDFHLKTELINDSLAEINIIGDYYSDKQMSASVAVKILQANIHEQDLIKINKGKNTYKYKIRIKNPELWWCNEAGKPFLYTVNIEIGNDSLLRKYSFKIGIRNVKLNTKADAQGSGFVIELNGKEIFCKGANYIPPDALQPEGSKDQIRKILSEAKANHMNMVRVWGGGVYPPPYFYELCDSLGLMVWQDFMFACAMYPFEGEYKKIIEEEITQQIIKYRNHPSLVLWCGNNENYEGWTNWGWQKQYAISSTDSTRIGSQYLSLFNVFIPTMVNRLDPGKPYRSTSPENGWGRPLAYARGDVHYWGVWWGMEPFESFKNKTGRFVSEYGFQGFPSASTLRKFGKPYPRDWKSPLLKSHQKHPKGFETIEQYLRTYFRYHSQCEKNIYLSQVLQAYGMETAIKAHRLAKPYCMGTLYWQLNDCWPVISWSTTDYYHHKKAAQYSVQKNYRNILPIIERNAGKINLFLVSDSLSPSEGKLRLTQYNLDGRVENDQIISVKISEGKNELIKSLDENYFLKSAFDSMKTMLVARLFINEMEYSSDYFFFCRPNQLMLQESAIKQELKQTPEGWKLTLLSTVPAFWVSLNLEEGQSCSEDYFHLLPFEEKIIQIKGDPSHPKKPIVKTSSLYENMH